MNEPTTSTTGIFRAVFHGLEESVLEELRRVAVRRSYPAGQMLIRQGDRGETFYVVVSGRVAVTQRLDDGEERMLGIRGPNEYFGEISLLDNTPRMATVTTLVPTTVLEITEQLFDRLVEESPAVAYSVTRTVVDTLRSIDQQAIEDLQSKNAALRQAYLELQMAQAALVEKERLERELEIAADVQRSLLPGRLPAYDRYRFAAFLEPARQIGGDLYDVIDLDEDHVAMVIADVADKSVQAALFMAVARTLFLMESQRTRSPVAVAAAVHKGILAVSPVADTFVTAFYGVLDKRTGRMDYIIAGHERPLLVRKDQAPLTLPGGGRFLGMLPNLDLREHSVQFESGDRLLLFSDGLTDVENPQGENYGYQRLQQALGRWHSLGAESMVHAILGDVSAWRQDADPVDDVTILVMEVR